MDTWSALQAIEVARAHLVDGRSLTEIAAELSISRFRAGRLMQAAREQGWVDIRIADPPGLDSGLSRELAELGRVHGVGRVLVTPDEGGRPALERAAADAIEDSAEAGDVVGLACGYTVNRVVSAIRRLPRSEVVQLTGLTAPGSVSDSSVETVRRAARMTEQKVRPVYEPMVQPTAALAAEKQQHPSLVRAFATWDRLRLALITIGSWEAGESNVFDAPALDEGLRQRATREGAVAEFCGHLIDREGKTVAPAVTACCLAVPLERLRATRENVVVVARAERSHAVVAALRAGVADTLVTAEGAARQVLENADRPGGRLL
ncbi:sugar-binding transcriptional regulator [Brachybacterium vulturis]|nr:sugar-binding domain-containing protein [Brachybacterium vulturis]